MFKKLERNCLILVLSLSTAAIADNPIRIDAESAQRNVCDLHVARMRGLVGEVSAILSESLRSRVDNERYNACPYRVTLEYQGVNLNIDFSNAFALQDILNYDGAIGISTGYFVFNEKGWHAENGGLVNGAEDIVIDERKGGLTIMGSFARRGIKSTMTEYCVGIAAIGKIGFATTGICSTDKTAVAPLTALLHGTSVFWFEK